MAFQKRLSVGPLRFNFSRRGVGTSVGISGLRIGQSATGRRYLTLGLPGSGLSYTKTLPVSGCFSSATTSQSTSPTASERVWA
jgi:hypothetical protein